MEAPCGGQDDVGAGQLEPGQGCARRALPPPAGALRAGAAQVGQQLAERPVPERGAGQVPLQGVVEVEGARITQAQHGDRRDRLGDRPEPVLDVVMRFRDGAASRRPRQARVSDDARDQLRHPAITLGSGRAGEQGPARTGEQVGHGVAC